MNSLKRLQELRNTLKKTEAKILKSEMSLHGAEISIEGYGLCTIIYFEGDKVILGYGTDEDDESYEFEISLDELIEKSEFRTHKE